MKRRLANKRKKKKERERKNWGEILSGRRRGNARIDARWAGCGIL